MFLLTELFVNEKLIPSFGPALAASSTLNVSTDILDAIVEGS